MPQSIPTLQQSWQIESKFKQEFLDFCELAASDDEVFKTFRENDRVKTIIENSTEEHKEKTIKWINASNESDKLYLSSLTPTEIRYIYITELKLKFFGFSHDSSIIEIGGGYGGLIYAFDRYLGRERQYAIYDLPQVQKLQARYLKDFGITPIFPEGIPEAPKHDLLISWCAWSELDLSTRKEYVEKVISKADRFIICSNYNFYEDMGILASFGIQPKVYSDELYSNIIYYER